MAPRPAVGQDRTVQLLLLACSPAQPDVGDDPPTRDSGASVVTLTTPEPTAPEGWEHLPVVILTAPGSLSTYGLADGQLELVTEHDGTLGDLAAAPREQVVPIGIEIHGSSSSGFPKPSFRFETRDLYGADEDLELLGLGSDSDWLLISNYGDKTHIRNAFAYALGARVADGSRWEPQAQFVEVVLNGSYYGIYLLVTRIKLDGDRVDLPAPAASAAKGEVSGGYVVKADTGRDEYWVTSRGSLVSWVDPKHDQITTEQDAYLRSWFDAFESTLDGASFSTSFSTWADPDSFVDHFLLNEIGHNIDAYRLSAYLSKEPDPDGGRLRAGPLWDFDRAFGNVNYCDCWTVEGLTMGSLAACGYGNDYPWWWLRLREDRGFQEAARCRWEELRAGPLEDGELLALSDALLAQVAEAQPRDEAVWHTIGVNVGHNSYVGATWQEEIDWFEAWVLDRAAWMDSSLPGTCP